MTIAAAQIERVRGYLPNEADTQFNWDYNKIGAVLAATNGSLAQTVRQFWLDRVTETFEFVDVNETTSSRSLSQVHANAKAMLDYWDKQVEAEGLISFRRSISFGEIDTT